MRVVLRYENGRAVWSENTPAYGATFQIRGELAKPAPRPAKGAGLTATQRKPDDRPTSPGRPRLPVSALNPEQAEARRRSWRESARRGRQRQIEYQRQYRARIRADVAAVREERAS